MAELWATPALFLDSVKRGHKSHACRTVSIESEEPRVKEKPTINDDNARVAVQPIRYIDSSMHMYSHDKAMKSSRRRKESQGRVNLKGWRGERNAEKAGGHKPTAKQLGNEAADDMTLGMTLTAPVSSRKDDGESAKASCTSIMPHGTETAS